MPHGADQLVFQVGIAGIEAVVLDALVRGHAGALEAAPHVAQLGPAVAPLTTAEMASGACPTAPILNGY